MLKFIHFVIWLAVWIGIGDALVRAVRSMRDSAITAHRQDQISYSRFTHLLTNESKNVKQGNSHGKK